MSYSCNKNGRLRIEEIVIFVRQECVEGVTHHSRSGEGKRESPTDAVGSETFYTVY